MKKFYSEKLQKFKGDAKKKHGVLWKRYLESAPRNPQLLQLKSLSTKLTFLIQKK